MSVNHESATLLESGAVSLSEHPSPLARRNLQRLGLSALLLFCVTSTIGLAYIVNVNNQVLAMLLQQQQQPSFGTSSSTVQPLRVYTQKLDTQYTAGSDTGAARVLIVHAAGTHLAKLARAVQEGVELVVSSADNLRVRTLENATFEEDVMWADAIILGTHVINANVEPKVIPASLCEWCVVLPDSNGCVSQIIDGRVREHVVSACRPEPQGRCCVCHQWRHVGW